MLNGFKLKNVLLVFAVIFIFTVSVFSQEKETSLCIYFENSEKIFVGTFRKQTKKIGNQENLTAEFSITQSLKGIEPNETRISADSDLYSEHLQTSEIYVVFLRYDKSSKNYKINAAFPVTFLDDNSNEPKNPQNVFQIAIARIPAGNLEDFKVIVTANGVKYYPKFTAGGIFTLVFLRGTKISVAVDIPFEENVVIEGITSADIKIEKGHTLVRYDLREMTGACDYKKFIFLPM